MKKKRTGKSILGLLLAVLMIVQLPLTALAENRETGGFDISEYTEEVIEPTVETAEDDMFSDGTDFVDIENTSDSVITENEKILEEDSSYEVDIEDNEENLESEEQIFDDIEDDDFLEAVETVDNVEIMLFSDTEESEEKEEPQTITVKVSISSCGEFLDDKDGKPMAGREVVLTGQSSYTMDDALKAAHDQYYQGGAEAGYEYGPDESGLFHGLIYKIWGYDRSDVSYIKSANNFDCADYQDALSRLVCDGDNMYFYIQQQKNVDMLAFFTESEKTVAQGNPCVLG